jgi:hypothetical protein
MGITVDQSMAEQIGMQPKTEAGILQDLSTVSGMQGVFTEGLTETEDLTTTTGLESVALGDGLATQKIERRILERQANSRANTGGAAFTSEGVVGVG